MMKRLQQFIIISVIMIIILLLTKKLLQTKGRTRETKGRLRTCAQAAGRQWPRLSNNAVWLVPALDEFYE